MRKHFIFGVCFVLCTVALGGCAVSATHVNHQSSLGYNETVYVFNVNSSISILPASPTSQPITGCTISPSLPSGLSLGTDCSVSGQSSSILSTQIFQVTAQLQDGSSQIASFWMQVVDPSLQSGGLAYNPSSYNFSLAPGAITPIVPSNTNDFVSCLISPLLPVGLVLQNNCQITGMILTPLSSTTYAVTGQSASGTYMASVTLAASFAEPLTGVTYYFDANAPGAANYSGCTANGQPWMDLSGNQNTMYLRSCQGSTGWLGSGTPADPYRFRSDATSNFTSGTSYSLNGNSGTILEAATLHNFTISMWTRAMQSSFTFFSAYRQGQLYNNVSLNDEYYFSGGIDQYNGLSGLWLGNASNAFTSWGGGIAEWHNYILTSQFVGNTGTSYQHNKNITLYIDGQQVSTLTNDTGDFEDSDFDVSGNAYGGYTLGGNYGIIEIAQWKFFNSVAMTQPQALSECQTYVNNFQGAACIGGNRSVTLSSLPLLASGGCLPVTMKLLDFQNSSSPGPSSNVPFTFQTTASSSDVQVFAGTDTACATPLSSINYLANTTSLTFNLSAQNLGPKTLSLVSSTPGIQKHDLTTTVGNPAVSFSAVISVDNVNQNISNNGNYNTWPGACTFTYGIIVSFKDANGQPATARTPTVVTLNAGSVGTFTGTLSPGATSVTISVPIQPFTGTLSAPGFSSSTVIFSATDPNNSSTCSAC